jgi:urease accessory protein UreE
VDLPQATALRDGDGLVLDDSSIVRVGRTASAVDPTRKALM